LLSALINAFRVPDLRKKILFTLFIILVYRIGCYIPVPGIPFDQLANAYESSVDVLGYTVLLNLFSGSALSHFAVFSLGIMPYITATIIMQLMQGVIPAVGRWAREGQTGQRKMTQTTRWLTLIIALLNAFGYLLLWQSSYYGITFTSQFPLWFTSCVIVITLVAGAALIMWLGELITQRGVGNGMSLIVFANIVSGFPSTIYSSITTNSNGILLTVLIILIVLICIPAIIFMERGQRRIPVNYAKRVSGRKMMGGQSTYIPLKVNAAGVIPIIFASALIYLPAQLAAIFSDVEWLQVFSNSLSNGWVNWPVTLLLIICFTYFYTSMVFNPEETADQIKKQGGFVPGVRPGAPTASYIKQVLNRITLPGSIYLGLIAVIPTICFYFTGDKLVTAFGGTSILIMVGVALDTMSKLESQLKMYNYDGFFK
jgi:preprotein translocase subunit SecY